MNGKAECRTSLYVARVSDEKIPPLAEIRRGILDYVSTVVPEMRVSDSGTIVFQNTQISFRVRVIPREKIVLLSFYPMGDNVQKWGKTDCANAGNTVIEFCDVLGDHFAVAVSLERLEFDRVSLGGILDASEWVVEFPLLGEAYSLRDFFGRIKEKPKYKWLIDRIKGSAEILEKKEGEDIRFLIFSKQFGGRGHSREVLFLKNLLSAVGNVDPTVRDLVTAREFVETHVPEGKELFVFLDEHEILEQGYANLKIYFDEINIPTQYIRVSTAKNKLRYPGIRANILLEVLTKVSKIPPVYLRPPAAVRSTNTGVLCLSDIRYASKQLFGALFVYPTVDAAPKEEVQIYKDISYNEDGATKELQFPDGALQLLAKKVSYLVGDTVSIDILLTKRWKEENIARFVELLKEHEISVNRVYYVSSRTARFVDEYIIKTVEAGARVESAVEYPYVFVGKSVAFLRTATELRIYPALFSLYIELFWPQDGSLSLEDLEKILWLTKKRMYRIQEFRTLKIPEPMEIFANVRKMYLKDFTGKLSIPLRLLI